ncbi:hypothetical protein PRZ48_005688 [Zasmidium cellare]|uniref:Uncharacterized protein n=1 Tax=Zasmidium cellare TaxID=395010 RepID=A0ABR0EM32_ZASCE|nr:hypothetical protein PRZ48_005688 [Zasmidium cellare]
MADPDVSDITITLHHQPCSPPDCSLKHPHIKPYTSKIYPTDPKSKPIGQINLYVFHKAKMDAINPGKMWEECQAFDAHHTGTKLDKIENFLANESFSTQGQDRIDHAEVVLFIDQGRGLAAVRETVKALQLPKKAIVMLQAGDAGGLRIGNVHEAGDKLTRHWKRLGFEEWSESDPSWLLLWLEDVYWV